MTPYDYQNFRVLVNLSNKFHRIYFGHNIYLRSFPPFLPSSSTYILPVTINNVEIPISAVTKYIGMHLDHKLSWRDHIVMKRKQIELKVKEFYWLLGRKSQLSIENKLLI